MNGLVPPEGVAVAEPSVFPQEVCVGAAVTEGEGLTVTIIESLDVVVPSVNVTMYLVVVVGQTLPGLCTEDVNPAGTDVHEKE